MEHYAKVELEEFKQETRGEISKAWLLKRKGRTTVWNVQAEYAVNGVNYRTSSKDDKDKTLSLGDSVTVTYSSKTPEMSKIKELVDYY